MRRLFLWLHLGIGISVALAVLRMSVTGVILTYEAQLSRWAQRDYRATPAPPIRRMPAMATSWVTTFSFSI